MGHTLNLPTLELQAHHERLWADYTTARITAPRSTTPRLADIETAINAVQMELARRAQQLP